MPVDNLKYIPKSQVIHLPHSYILSMLALGADLPILNEPRT